MMVRTFIPKLVLLAGLFACSAQKPVKTTSVGETAAEAQHAVASCTDPEFDQLDFWIGDWDLEWDLPDGKRGAGRNIITQSPYGNCVITENFDGAPGMNFKGMSVSTYQKQTGQWRQSWVDDQGGYFALAGGPTANNTFTLTMTRLNDKGPHRRMVWADITDTSLVWRWQGHAVDDAEQWKDLWVIRYTRRP